MSVRLTATIGRRKGMPHRPETLLPGGRFTQVCESWAAALVRLAELVEQAEGEGRRVNQATITELAIADRSYERGHRVEG